MRLFFFSLLFLDLEPVFSVTFMGCFVGGGEFLLLLLGCVWVVVVVFLWGGIFY